MPKTTFVHGTTATPEFLNAINNPTYSESPDADGQIPYPDADGIGLTAEIERATEAETALQEAVDLCESKFLRVTLGQGGIHGFQWKVAGGTGVDLDPATPASPISSLLLGPESPSPFLLSLSLGLNLASVVGTGTTPVKAEIEVPEGEVELELRDRLLAAGTPLFTPCFFLQSTTGAMKAVYAAIYVNSFLPDPKPITIAFRDSAHPGPYLSYTNLLADFTDHSNPIWISMNFSGVI